LTFSDLVVPTNLFLSITAEIYAIAIFAIIVLIRIYLKERQAKKHPLVLDSCRVINIASQGFSYNSLFELKLKNIARKRVTINNIQLLGKETFIVALDKKNNKIKRYSTREYNHHFLSLPQLRDTPQQFPIIINQNSYSKIYFSDQHRFSKLEAAELFAFIQIDCNLGKVLLRRKQPIPLHSTFAFSLSSHTTQYKSSGRCRSLLLYYFLRATTFFKF